jgi:hypothetical protein
LIRINTPATARRYQVAVTLAGGWTVGSGYTVRNVSARELEQAFDLFRLADPDMEQEEWQAFCAPSGGTEGSLTPFHHRVLVAVGPTGHVRAVCVLEAAQSDRDGGAVNIPTFVVGSAADPDGVLIALLRALVAICQESGYRRLRIWLPRDDRGAVTALGAAIVACAEDLKCIELELI